MSEVQPQRIPVRVYQTDRRIMVAAPMPGLEPENITVTVGGTRVVIKGDLRGEDQDDRDLLLKEWNIGPYFRELTLPEAVSGQLANATYGNGVLVLSLPKVGHGEEGIEVTFQLERLAQPTRGERIGHEGLNVEPTTTEQDRQARQETSRQGGTGANDDIASLGESAAERLDEMEQVRDENHTRDA